MERNALVVFLLVVGVADCDFQSSSDCDLVAESSICFGGGTNVVVGDAHPPQLSAKYSFDDKHNIDSSGNSNHGSGKVGVGPGVGFSGASAHFEGTHHIVVPHSTSFTSNIFSMTFWLHVERLPQTANCVLVAKGSEGKKLAPGIFLTRMTNRLVIKTCDTTFISRARVRPQKWLHVALTRSQSSVSLYFNGVLDVVKEVGAGCNNEGNLYLGGTPRSECDFSAYMDEVRYYQRVVEPVEIAAEASPALGGVRPSFAHLGCQNCTLNEAKLSCRPSYHLCTTMELYTGAFVVARILGYTDWRSNVWTTADVVAQAKTQAKNRRLYSLMRGSAGQNTTRHVSAEELTPGTAMCCSDVI